MRGRGIVPHLEFPLGDMPNLAGHLKPYVARLGMEALGMPLEDRHPLFREPWRFQASAGRTRAQR